MPTRQRRFVWSVALGVLLTMAASLPMAAAAPTVELEFMTNAWAAQVIDSIKESLARFEQLNPNIKVTVTSRGSSWDTFITHTVAGAPPDVVTLGVFQSGEYMEQNLIQPLNKFVTPQLRSELWEPMWQNFMWQGKIHAVPALESGPRLGMTYNLDMLDESGIAVNSRTALTWNAFFDICDKLTRVDANGKVLRVGYDPLSGQDARLYTVAPLWDAQYFDAKTGYPTLNSPALINMVETFTDRVFRRYNYAGIADTYSITKKQVASALLGAYGPGEIRTRDPQMRIQVTWPPHVQNKRVQQVLGWGMAIPQGAKHPEESFKLIEFLATDIPFQIDLFNRSGFMGASKRFMSRLMNETRDENIKWYIDSLSSADIMSSPVSDRFISRASSLFSSAANKVFKGTEPAASALAEANRLLTVEMQTQGRIK